MKSTYKLIGLMWDHKPEVKKLKIACAGENAVPPGYTEPYTLFDLAKGKYERIVPLSKLLRIEKENDFSKIIEKVVFCDNVYIFNDFEPASDSEINIDFYKKRVNQIVLEFENRLGREITVLENTDKQIM